MWPLVTWFFVFYQIKKNNNNGKLHTDVTPEIYSTRMILKEFEEIAYKFRYLERGELKLRVWIQLN